MANEQFTWITPAGTPHRLDSNVEGVRIVDEVDGRGMPPIRRTTETVPLQPGTRTRSILHDEHEVALGLYFAGQTPTDLRGVVRTWINLLDPTKGQGILQVTGPDGAVRQLSCTYQDGLQLVEPSAMRSDQLAVVTFAASDPYWADPTDSTEAWSTGGSASFFTSPFFPLRLGASESFGASDITNSGDVDTYPAWLITGPVTQLTLSNATTGRSLQWAGTLGASEFMLIDARPGTQTQSSKSVIKNDGSNLFGGLSAPWDFWPFAPGVQTVNVSIAGAAGTTHVTALWRNRYLSA